MHPHHGTRPLRQPCLLPEFILNTAIEKRKKRKEKRKRKKRKKKKAARTKLYSVYNIGVLFIIK